MNIFNKAHDFQLGDLIVNQMAPDWVSWALEKLQARTAAEAMHDSKERCDAPKCHPDTRIAAQDDIYSWIIYGGGDSEPKKLKWITGPAGTGKTAVMGSIAERCKANGLLAASFFFSALSPSIDRRQKTAFVPTLAYQLAQHSREMKYAVADAIEQNPLVFEMNLFAQMETLVLQPLREVRARPENDPFRWPRVMLVDGLDECDVERHHRSEDRRRGAVRTKADDQLEILQVLYQATLDRLFPFRVIIASRPERVFREFFIPEAGQPPIAHILNLHEKYSADEDIALFLRVKFAEIQRRYHLSHSWCPRDAIPTLVRNASGQFIYAATVVRFITDSARVSGRPQTLLHLVLQMGPSDAASQLPFAHIDALYTHVLQSSPDPGLAVLWIWFIRRQAPRWASSCEVNQFLQTVDGEAEHLLGNLHSLVKIPPSDDFTTPYDLYHKSLLDFITDPDRSKQLCIDFEEAEEFILNRYLKACRRQGDVFPPVHQGRFTRFLVSFCVSSNTPHPTTWPLVSLDDIEWWARETFAFIRDQLRDDDAFIRDDRFGGDDASDRLLSARCNITYIFDDIHSNVSAELFYVPILKVTSKLTGSCDFH
ncbi:hypothetical protein EST38_g8041 [Candolleomyces aberdarensis]|uniref:Nephrocystin 3-like N-terminal domain-containing protein n=1 Tax=Candolleomyces aberdarensis TaxID=2316362 RepID=A0A4Q2DGF9_9AGAR|nr:hypothetical protein EST38_g8041 [Candolleomyces aberdarensis]